MKSILISFLLGICTLHLFAKIPPFSYSILAISILLPILLLLKYFTKRVSKNLQLPISTLASMATLAPNAKNFGSKPKTEQSYYKLYLLSKPSIIRLAIQLAPKALFLAYKSAILGLTFCLGFLYMSMHAQTILSKKLPEELHGKKFNIIGTIASLPEAHENEQEASIRFEFDPIEIKAIESVNNASKSIQSTQSSNRYSRPSTKVNSSRSDNSHNSITKIWQNPGRIKVLWKDPPLNLRQNPKPGDIWAFSLKLKCGRNYANPGSFDKEKHLFINRIAAEGFVIRKGTAKQVESHWYKRPIDRLRQILYEKIKRVLDKRALGGLILALVIGTKDGISNEHWSVLQDTGTAHLMAISGLHVGLVATLAFTIVNFGWRRLPNPFLTMASYRAGAFAALLAALFYALLAGFSVPTERSLIMVTVFMLAVLLRRNISYWHSFFLALGLVILHDPLATLSPGFYLSFGAVGMILYGMRGRLYHKLNNTHHRKDKHLQNKINRDNGNRNSNNNKKEIRYKKGQKETGLNMNLATIWWKWGRAQWVVFLGLMPITFAIFGQVSIVSPLANLLSIPWVSFIVVPLALLAALISPICSPLSDLLLRLSESSLAIIWSLLEYMKSVPYPVWVNTESGSFSLLMACVAVIWLLGPKGFPGKGFALVFLLPLIFDKTPPLKLGQALVTILDVGQGLSTVVETQNHMLVFDTGPRLSPQFDTGDRVVVPYLKTRGKQHIDTLIISHGDNDHMGGMQSIVKRTKVNDIITSEVETVSKSLGPKFPKEHIQNCYAGQEWTWDEVQFKILHPESFNTKKRNDHSCVLRVEAAGKSVLITADIETVSEHKLINRYGSKLHSDILLVPHHGSRTSSSSEFIAEVKPQYGVIPVGFGNSYGHPKPDIVARYEDLGIKLYDSIHNGAISFLLDGVESPICYRQYNRHYWIDN